MVNFRKKCRLMISLIVVIMLLSALSISAAAVADTLNCWYSDTNQACYLKYDGSIYKVNLSTNSTFTTYFDKAVSSAVSQWNNALPISVSERSASYALQKVFGGTRSQLTTEFPSLPTSADGMCISATATFVKLITYSGSSKAIYEYGVGGKYCIVEKSKTQNGYTNTALHEMGHLFGWVGHSTNNTHVMYSICNSVTSLTTADKNHIVQIYNLYY